jgi:hypothetical protein
MYADAISRVNNATWVVLALVGAAALIRDGGAFVRSHTVKRARPRLLAVWLRRFHQTGEDQFPMALLFAELSAWGALTCTLGDTAVDRSPDAEAIFRDVAKDRLDAEDAGMRKDASDKAMGILMLLTPVFCVIFVGAMISVRHTALPIQLAAAVVAAAAVVLLCCLVWSWRYQLHYPRAERRARLDQILEAQFQDQAVITATEAPWHFRNLASDLSIQTNVLERGFLVLRVSDVDWQVVVENALKNADVVLVDVSHISENVAWELATLSRVGGAQVVLALGVERGSSWRDHPSCANLSALLGEGWQDRYRVFDYPAKINPKQRHAVARRHMGRFLLNFYEAAAQGLKASPPA